MKKVLALGLALCLVLMGLTGCQQTAPVATPADTAVATDAATTADAATAAPVSGELNVAIAADIAPDSVTEWTKMFNADYPDVKLNVALEDASSYEVTIEPLIAAGELPDVLGIGCTDWFATLADKGYFLDVSGTPGWNAQLDVLKQMYTSSTGVHFAVANGVETELLYYNIDQFKQAGIQSVPTNWQEFLDCCQKLKDAGFQPLAVAGASPNNLGHSFISFGIAHQIVQSGYDPNWNIKARDGEYDFSTPEWQSVLDKAVVLRDAGYFQRGYESADLYECMRAVAAGEVAMTIQGSYQTGNILIDGGANIGITTVPWNDPGKDQVGIVIAGDGYAMGKNSSNNVDLATKFFNYVTFEKAYVYQNMSGTIPPWIDAAKDMPNAVVNDKLKAAWDASNALTTKSLEPQQAFTAIVYEQVKQFVQAVILGTAEPSQIGDYLNPAQQEYLATLEK